MTTQCELCNSKDNLTDYKVEPKNITITICDTCNRGIKNIESIDNSHWHCLNDSMWSESESVKVVVYRLLTTLSKQDLLDTMYIEDETKKWAIAGIDNSNIIHKDANGVILSNGDSISILKDLDVKGTSFVAKRGTIVKNIRLEQDDIEHIQGRVNGTTIFLKTCFIKKV